VALKEIAQCPPEIGVYEVGFQLGPRLNAAGRLETAEESLRLILSADLASAKPLAQRLDSQNRERQAIERSIVTEASGVVRSRFNPQTDFVIVEGQLLWHVGVVGIVASRLLNEFYRPTIVIGGDGEAWRGSGRSIAGFDLAAALRECDDLLIRHGGHAMAGGLTVYFGKMDLFCSRMKRLPRRHVKPGDFQTPLRLAAEVALEELNLGTLGELNRLLPTGQGNPPAHFAARGVTHQRPLQRIGAEKQHVKMWINDGTATHEAVWWRAGNESLPVGKFDLA